MFRDDALCSSTVGLFCYLVVHFKAKSMNTQD